MAADVDFPLPMNRFVARAAAPCQTPFCASDLVIDSSLYGNACWQMCTFAGASLDTEPFLNFVQFPFEFLDPTREQIKLILG